jgi:hypothetical protein
VPAAVRFRCATGRGHGFQAVFAAARILLNTSVDPLT